MAEYKALNNGDDEEKRAAYMHLKKNVKEGHANERTLRLLIDKADPIEMVQLAETLDVVRRAYLRAQSHGFLPKTTS